DHPSFPSPSCCRLSCLWRLAWWNLCREIDPGAGHTARLTSSRRRSRRLLGTLPSPVRWCRGGVVGPSQVIAGQKPLRPSPVLGYSAASGSRMTVHDSVLHDPALAVAPVAVSQQALVELASRQPGQLGLEVDRARHLLAREVLAAEGDQLLGGCRTGR